MNKNGITPVVVGIIFLVAVGAGVGYSLYDQDSDGLRNYEEWTGKSSFTNADTDDDGLQDGAEVNDYNTDPSDSDSDGDGLGDGVEVNQYGTNPLEPDSDLDGLGDGVEVNQYGTNPLEPDSDLDGLNDGVEAEEWSISVSFEDTSGEYEQVNVHSDPNSKDTDEDNLNDLKERNYETNPSKKDSDEDNLDDFEEVNEFKTSATNFDTDSDGLSDGEEILELNSNPVYWDTDNDALGDGVEVSMPRANLLVKDIFVEVDWTETSQSLPADVRTKLKTVFDKAPIKNPDGSQGVNLHIDVDDQVPTNADFLKSENLDGSLNDFYDFRNRFFTPERENTHHYALLTKFAEVGEEPFGGIAISGGFMVSTYALTKGGKQIKEVDKNIGTTFMHELGHRLGLNSWDFSGIDSKDYSYKEYPSVMNYNSFKDEVTSGNYIFTVMEAYEYSSGGIFDDWAHLKKGFDPF